MPRNARVVIPGVALAVTTRGKNRQEVFLVDAVGEPPARAELQVF